jgi:hypothetical protein
VSSAVHRSRVLPARFVGGAKSGYESTSRSGGNTATQMAGAVSSSAKQRSPHRRWSTSASGCRGMETAPEMV